MECLVSIVHRVKLVMLYYETVEQFLAPVSKTCTNQLPYSKETGV